MEMSGLNRRWACRGPISNLQLYAAGATAVNKLDTRNTCTNALNGPLSRAESETAVMEKFTACHPRGLDSLELPLQTPVIKLRFFIKKTDASVSFTEGRGDSLSFTWRKAAYARGVGQRNKASGAYPQERARQIARPGDGGPHVRAAVGGDRPGHEVAHRPPRSAALPHRSRPQQRVKMKCVQQGRGALRAAILHGRFAYSVR